MSKKITKNDLKDLKVFKKLFGKNTTFTFSLAKKFVIKRKLSRTKPKNMDQMSEWTVVDFSDRFTRFAKRVGMQVKKVGRIYKYKIV
jgi:hypothetical protein